MGAVSIKREEPFKHDLKLVDTKEAIINALIITGIGVYISGRLSDASLYDKIKNHKDKTIDFEETKKKKKIRKKKLNSQGITIEDWLNKNHSDDELQELFLNMSLAMNYIHDKGFCIKSFSPKEIEILDDSVKQVRFDNLLKMPNDTYIKKEIVREDIYNSALLQVGAYMNNISTNDFENRSITDFLNKINPSYLKSDFNSFSPFIPESVFPWANGVIVNGASVYYHVYLNEKKNRDMQQLSKQFGEDGGNSNTNSNSISQTKGKAYVYSNSAGKFMGGSNDENNKRVYPELDNRLDAAFITAFIIPIIMVIFGVVLMVVAFMTGR